MFFLKLKIVYDKLCKDRPWVLIRECDDYNKHSHFHTRKNANLCRSLIDKGVMPYNIHFQKSIQRLLTDKEFDNLARR